LLVLAEGGQYRLSKGIQTVAQLRLVVIRQLRLIRSKGADKCGALFLDVSGTGGNILEVLLGLALQLFKGCIHFTCTRRCFLLSFRHNLLLQALDFRVNFI
jgi:hypothetical protein